MAGTETIKKRKGMYAIVRGRNQCSHDAAAPSAGTPPKKAKTSAATAAKPTAKPKSKQAPVVVPAEELAENSASSDGEDDQTAALLKGFESSDEEDEKESPDAEAITQIPSLPDSADLKSKLVAATKNPSDEVGVIYLGRIPHGFYESQMKEYFVQFGAISRLRLARNRKTGASKHFAFIEFAQAEVAKIAADTMNNYLMFGHILKAKVIPKDDVHEKLFDGAGKRFKKIPWNKIERFQLGAAGREGWKKRVENEHKRRDKKAKAMKELGYEYKAPELRSVDDVPVNAPKEIKPQAEEAKPQAIEAAPAKEDLPAAEEPAKPVSEKKSPSTKKKSTAKDDASPVAPAKSAKGTKKVGRVSSTSRK